MTRPFIVLATLCAFGLGCAGPWHPVRLNREEIEGLRDGTLIEAITARTHRPLRLTVNRVEYPYLMGILSEVDGTSAHARVELDVRRMASARAQSDNTPLIAGLAIGVPLGVTGLGVGIWLLTLLSGGFLPKS